MSRRRTSLPIAISIVLIGAAVAWFKDYQAPQARPALDGQVVAVIDGDTIGVLTGGVEVRVRLSGIDAPERGQPFGDNAKRELSARVFGRIVRLETTTNDRYGRTVARVICDSQDINAALVRDGLAWWYREYAPESRELEQLEAEARRERRGLWRDQNPVPPWNWRKGTRTGQFPPRLLRRIVRNGRSLGSPAESQLISFPARY